MSSLSFSSLVSSATNLSRSVSALAASTDAHLRQLDDEQTDAVDRIVQPPQRATFNSAAQRAEMHDRLTKQAFAANAAGDTAEAASLFAQASGFDPRPTTILSHVNMRLKLGECELAVASYERLLAGETLSETAWFIAAARHAEALLAEEEKAQAKRAEATVVEQRSRED